MFISILMNYDSLDLQMNESPEQIKRIAHSHTTVYQLLKMSLNDPQLGDSL